MVKNPNHLAALPIQIPVAKFMYMLYPKLEKTILEIASIEIPAERKVVLTPCVHYITNKIQLGEIPQLNFICTHNSRRSQLSQIWAEFFAYWFQIPFKGYSGGVEVTAMNQRAVEALKNQGFEVNASGDMSNPMYSFQPSPDSPTFQAFSKLFHDEVNPTHNFAAIMTCSDADENCPYIPGADCRIPVRYVDPKVSDDTPQEKETYAERSLQIASEWKYVFEQVKLNT